MDAIAVVLVVAMVEVVVVGDGVVDGCAVDECASLIVALVVIGIAVGVASVVDDDVGKLDCDFVVLNILSVDVGAIVVEVPGVVDSVDEVAALEPTDTLTSFVC